MEESVPFATPEELRAWLEANHDTSAELWVRLAKKGRLKPRRTSGRAPPRGSRTDVWRP